MSDNFYSAIDQVMKARPDHVAFVDPEGTPLTFAGLDARVAQLSAALNGAGVKPGERVLVQLEKSLAGVALYLATLRIGAVYVPINSAYTDAEVAYFVEDCGPVLFVHEQAAPPSAALSKVLARLAVRTCAIGRLPEDRPDAAQTGPATLVADSERASAESVSAIAALSADQLAAIVYTSGTTGRSKGAMLSHGNIESNARALLELWGWQQQDVLLHALPIFHVHGLFVALHCALLGGSTVRFLPRFDAENVLKELPHSTVLMGVPTFYTRLLALAGFQREALGRMRLFISGSAPLTEQTFAAFEARTGQRILERYGMSETLMITSNPLVGERLAGTVGYALPEVATRIVDEEGRPCPPETVGMIEVRGPNVFSGYWQQPEKTAAEFRSDGFFQTGDLGLASADGRVSIVGRAKDLVISGGYNVYPKELERLLDALEGVKESAVIGVPHADFGEAVVAVLVPANPAAPPTLEQINGALADSLARFKQPKACPIVTELPRNAMGKVQKNLLRTQFETLFATTA